MRPIFVMVIGWVIVGWATTLAWGGEAKLLIAFSSYRERPQHPQVYFYEHDGAATGRMLDGIPTIGKRSDYHPTLAANGQWCAFASEMENETSRILLWNRDEKKLVDMPGVNDSPQALLWPTLSGDGGRLAFAAWNRPGASQRWDLFLFDRAPGKLRDLLVVNTLPHDERMPALSGDGHWLAFVTNAQVDRSMDVALVNLESSEAMKLDRLNSEHRDVEPSVSHNGQLIAFSSDRPDGQGLRDIYLYDAAAAKLVELPGLNSAAHEQTPSLSPDGRYLAFVSERIRGEGERDLYLYDREQQKLLATPGLNARQEDIDPCVIVLPGN